ncbi:MAG: DUF4363 family protein [Oscillospiraceae bacterium]|jgi:hypothetical protein|nr:DUF4363 family protein [Oscillospiraceae bacterium]
MKKVADTIKLYAKELVVTALFAAAFIFSLTNIAYTEHLAGRILGLSREAVAYAESGDYAESRKKAEAALAEWRENHNRMHVFLRHETVWAVENALVTLENKAAEHEADGIRLAAETLGVAISGITEIERITPGSVF